MLRGRRRGTGTRTGLAMALAGHTGLTVLGVGSGRGDGVFGPEKDERVEYEAVLSTDPPCSAISGATRLLDLHNMYFPERQRGAPVRTKASSSPPSYLSLGLPCLSAASLTAVCIITGANLQPERAWDSDGLTR